MATRQAKGAPQVSPVKARKTEVLDLGPFGFDSMKRYGIEVNEGRSVPSYQDGMKPVIRRLVYGAHQVAQRQCKTARLVGHVIGTLHPHGDASVADAAATVVMHPTPGFDGVGNWGSLLDDPAHMRYTELLLNRYGQQFLQPDYLAITPMMPNYDDREREPLFLPALLPNILLNPNSGIGLGVTTNIPAFTPVSVLKACVALLNGEKIGGAQLASSLVFNESWGGRPVKSKENRASILSLMEGSSRARVQFDSNLEIDEAKRTITLHGAAPRINLATFLRRARLIKGVTSVEADKSGVVYTVQVSKRAPPAVFDAIKRRIQTLTRSALSYSIYVCKRTPVEDDKFEVTFHRHSVLSLLKAWLQFRLTLEYKCTQYRISRVAALQHRLSLMIQACDHLDAIFKALRTNDPAAGIAKAMKISLDDANLILELKVRQLSKLDQDALKAKLAATHVQLKNLNRILKNPEQAVVAYLEACIAHFHAHDKKVQGCVQWELTLPQSAQKAILSEGEISM